MPRDATKYAGGHTSALGELFIADERERMQGEVYEFDSGGEVSKQIRVKGARSGTESAAATEER
jgi:hypothetical protein